jgi:hypothetical protein
MTINLKLKRPKSKKSVIWTEFKKNGVHFKFYSGKSVNTKNWSETKQVVLSGEDNFEWINKYLENWVSEIKKIFSEMEAAKERPMQEIVQAKLDQRLKADKLEKTETITEEGKIQVTDFTSFMEHFIELKRSDGKFLQKLEQAHKSVLAAFNLVTPKKLKEYDALSIKAKSNTLLKADYKYPFKDVNLKFLQDFKSHLNKSTYKIKEKGIEVTKHYTTNYIDKQISGLKQFVNGAIEAKYVEYFTWDSLKSNGNSVDTVHTDFKQIQVMHDTVLDKENEIKIRDKYVINCFLGFRYSDLNRLEPHVFKKRQVKGIDYLVYEGRSKKTGEFIEFPIHPIAAALLEKYNYQIPKYSAKEFNEVIKIVAKKAGLEELIRIRETRAGKTTTMDIPMFELICSHTGRRSFCTNFYVEGVAIAIIMSISGHLTEKEFMRYIKKRSVRLEVAAEQISAIKGINLLKVA